MDGTPAWGPYRPSLDLREPTVRHVHPCCGGSTTATRKGEFSVFSMSRDHVSSLDDTSMPFALFFSRGQTVHHSPDLASVGEAVVVYRS